MGVWCLSFSSTIIILQCMCYCSLANVTGNFTEIPSLVTVEVVNGVHKDAVFRCRHQRVDVLISWLVNGSLSVLYPDVDDGFIRESNGTRIDTLTIPAIPEYNGMEVVCVANFFDGSPREVTPPANLTIIIVNTVTSEVITQPPPTTTMKPGFVMTPSSLNKTVEQGEAVFRCQHRRSDDITWRMNGTSVSSSNISEWRVPVGDGDFVSFLSIATLPGFNNTTIECGAIFFDNSPLLFTPPVTLLIQGIPGYISNLGFERNYSSGVLTTFWDPLPTLDITDRDPDIIYRVQIFKTTCGQSVLMSDKNVTGNITLSPLELMDIYTAIITPRNNVPGYVDGPKERMKEKFMPLNWMTLFELSRRRQKIIESVLPLPHNYTMMLESLDGIGNNTQISISVQRDGEMVTMKVEKPLPPKYLWNALILPHNCEADMQVTELSTHDIQNVVVTVNPSYPGALQLTGEFVDESEATGVLWMVCSLNNDSDIQYIHMPKQPEQNSIGINVTGLAGVEYGISSFALENGLPFPRVVTSPTNVTVTAADNDDQETIPQPPTSVDYELRYPTSTGVCITCSFPMDNSATDCVAVVHQRISQVSSSGLMNIELSHKFTRSGDTAYGCIEGVNLEQYQVGVIGGKMIQPTTLSNDNDPSLSGTVVGTVLGIMAFILIAVLLIMIGIVCFLRRIRLKVSERGPLYMYREVGIVPPRLQSDGFAVRANFLGRERGWYSYNIEDGPSGLHLYAESGASLREETERVTSAEGQSLAAPPLPPRLEQSLSLVDPPPPPRLDESVMLVEDHPPVADSVLQQSHDTMKESDGPPPPPPHQDTSKNGSKTYAQLELPSKAAVPPAAATERLIYDNIHGFQNKEVPTLKKVLDDLHKVEYSEIQPKTRTRGEVTSTEPDRTAEQAHETGTPPPPRDCLTADSFFSRMVPYASKWQSLGEALSLDDDHLDEIFTNNETDEACLQEMLEVYMMRSDYNHSWEEIETTLKRIANGVQESDTSSISPVIDGSTTFSSDVHTNTQDTRSPSHISDKIRVPVHAKTRCIPDTAIMLDEMQEIHHDIDKDFKSEPDLPNSQGSVTDDQPKCITSYNLKDEITLPAADNDEIDRQVNWEKPVPSSPCNIQFCLFVTTQGYDEEVFDPSLLQYVPQEPYMQEVTDYNTALIKQLGLSKWNLSSRNHYQESSEEINIAVHTGSVLEPIEFLNCTSLSQGMQSSLHGQKLPPPPSTHEDSNQHTNEKTNCPNQSSNVHSTSSSLPHPQHTPPPPPVTTTDCSRTEPQSVIERTVNQVLWTDWEQLDIYELLSQVYSSIKECTYPVLQYLSNFMPLAYPT